MGCCYSISLELVKPNVDKITDTLKKVFSGELKIGEELDIHPNFGEDSLHCQSLADCLSVVFPASGTTPEVDDDSLTYNTCFDASYSWEVVMIEIFKIMCPYIGEESSLIISNDEDETRELMWFKGKCFQYLSSRT